MRLLIAEDNTALSEGLAYCLGKAGHQVALAADGQSALQALAVDRFDLLVLDYGLPLVHGAEVLRQVRAQPRHLFVMLFSALHDAEARIERLGLSVDDFLAKPFSLIEFEQRIAKLERRLRGTEQTTVSFGPITCDLTTGVVRVGDDVLDMPADERSLLEVLVRRASDPVDPDELARQLAPSNGNVAPDTLERCVQRLSARLGHSTLRIVKLRGLGYCLAVAP